MGGSDKKLEMNGLLKELPTLTKSVVLLAGSGSDRIRPKLEALAKKKQIALITADSLPSALRAALLVVEKGDTILFSPAFASFGMFKNEYDRGEQFTALVKML